MVTFNPCLWLYMLPENNLDLILQQPLLTCQQRPQTPALQSAPRAWMWAGTAWPATLYHIPSPSRSQCFGKLRCGHKQSSLYILSLFCCHRSHTKSVLGWCEGCSGTGLAPTVLLLLSSPPVVHYLIWRLVRFLPGCLPSRYHTERRWCCRAR